MTKSLKTNEPNLTENKGSLNFILLTSVTKNRRTDKVLRNVEDDNHWQFWIRLAIQIYKSNRFLLIFHYFI